MDNNSSLIKEWFFENFENIVDEVEMMTIVKADLIENNESEFEEEIDLQSYDEFVRSVSINCSTQLGLHYDQCYDILEDNLEALYHALD